jgi:hypothetical protein
MTASIMLGKVLRTLVKDPCVSYGHWVYIVAALNLPVGLGLGLGLDERGSHTGSHAEARICCLVLDILLGLGLGLD